MEPAPKLPPKPVREQAKVMYAYLAQNEDELTIKEGDIINIINKDIEDHGWWRGELNGKIGVFPDNFVTIIKNQPQEEAVPPRNKKPDRIEKVPLPSESSPKQAVPTNSNKVDKTLKVEENKEVLPSLPFKKPKPPAPNHKAPNQASNKPDVVPQETAAKSAKEESETLPVKNESQFTFLDTNSKLNHLTADRPKGPSRRPPSYIAVSKDSEDDLENGDDLSKVVKEFKNEASKPLSQSQKPTIQSDQTSPQTTPAWMQELKKNQEDRRKNPPANDIIEINSKEEVAKVISPKKNSPNRASGDFSKLVAKLETPSEQQLENSNPISILKPTKPVKPGLPLSSQASPPTGSLCIPANKVQNSVSGKYASNYQTGVTTLKEQQPIATSNHILPNSELPNKELIELNKELKLLKESIVSKNEFDDLQKQVNDLKDLVETQKQSYTKLIKDLINDVAEERKKLATLQIEVDRLRKLTTTV